MTALPPSTTKLTVDYGEPDWREPVGEEDPAFRAQAGYADLTHDGASIWIKFDGQHEIEMRPKGARIIAAALLAMADHVESGR